MTLGEAPQGNPSLLASHQVPSRAQRQTTLPSSPAAGTLRAEGKTSDETWLMGSEIPAPLLTGPVPGAIHPRFLGLSFLVCEVGDAN